MSDEDTLANKPKPVWVTIEEGGDYIPWPEWQLQNNEMRIGMPRDIGSHGYYNHFRIHSVGFEDGSVFDNVIGWRTWSVDRVPRHLLVRMGLYPYDPDIRWPVPGEAVRVPDTRGFWARLLGWGIDC